MVLLYKRSIPLQYFQLSRSRPPLPFWGASCLSTTSSLARCYRVCHAISRLEGVGIFLKLIPFRCSVAVGKDAPEFLIFCSKRLHTLSLLEREGQILLHKLDGPAKQLACLYVHQTSYVPTGILKEFSKVFLEKFIPSLKDNLWDQLSILQKGPITVSYYEARSHELSKHETMIFPTEEKRNKCLCQGTKDAVMD